MSHAVSLFSDERLQVTTAPSASFLTRAIECFTRGKVPRDTLRPHIGRPVYIDVEFERVSRGALEDVRTLGPEDVVIVLRRRGTLEESGRVQIEEGKVASYVEDMSRRTNLRKAEEGDIAAVARQVVLRSVPLVPGATRQLLGGSGGLSLR